MAPAISRGIGAPKSMGMPSGNPFAVAGILYITQCTNGGGFPASGSSHTTASSLVAAGTLLQDSGGEIFGRSGLYSRGIVSFIFNVALSTTIFCGSAITSSPSFFRTRLFEQRGDLLVAGERGIHPRRASQLVHHV